MAQSESQPSESEQSENQETGVCKQLLHFNEHGQPIGEGSAQFSTFVGKVARAHCPPTYLTWHDVPITIKDKIWSIVLETYDVPIIHKGMVLSKANVSWKLWKYSLRMHCDRFQTSAERKINPPKRVKRKVWETFVDICSTEQERARREKGKSSRENMKNPHTTGRRGAAKTAEELKKQSPNATVTRTQLYLASHTKKDGTCPFPVMKEQIDEIRRIILTNPILGEGDLDNDPVAKVCGRDGKGWVRGMGKGVSKTAIQASAPAREIAQREKRARESIELNFDILLQRLEEECRARKSLEEKVAQREKRARESIESNFDVLMQRLEEECRARKRLEEKVNALSDHLLSQATHMSDSTDQFSCSSPARKRSLVLPDSPVDQSSSRCLLKNFKKKVVALGHVNRKAPTSAKSYSIIIDDIYEIHAELYACEGTLQDVTLGDTITWPEGLLDFI